MKDERKKGKFRTKVSTSSVRASVRPFLVNVSPPKPLDLATSNFVAA